MDKSGSYLEHRGGNAGPAGHRAHGTGRVLEASANLPISQSGRRTRRTRHILHLDCRPISRSVTPRLISVLRCPLSQPVTSALPGVSLAPSDTSRSPQSASPVLLVVSRHVSLAIPFTIKAYRPPSASPSCHYQVRRGVDCSTAVSRLLDRVTCAIDVYPIRSNSPNSSGRWGCHPLPALLIPIGVPRESACWKFGAE